MANVEKEHDSELNKTKNRIEYYRKILKVTPQEFSTFIGKSKTRLSDIEKMRRHSLTYTLASEITTALVNISREKSKGKQILLINVSDVFYI